MILDIKFTSQTEKCVDTIGFSKLIVMHCDMPVRSR